MPCLTPRFWLYFLIFMQRVMRVARRGRTVETKTKLKPRSFLLFFKLLFVFVVLIGDKADGGENWFVFYLA